MITLRHSISLGILTTLALFGIACSSTAATPSTSPTVQPTLQPAVNRDDAVQIALATSQDLYDNLRSLGAVGVTALPEPEPRSDLSPIAGLFGERSLPETGASGAWLVEVKLAMIGTPSNSGTSYTLYAIDASSGRLISQFTSSTQSLPILIGR